MMLISALRRVLTWSVLGSALFAVGLANAADKSGVRADVFIGLDREAKEIYVAGITDALDEGGMLECPPGTSYSQVITLAEAYIYRNRKQAASMWAATAIMQALRESSCARVGKVPGLVPSTPQGPRRQF